jgi:hypothetical protein
MNVTDVMDAAAGMVKNTTSAIADATGVSAGNLTAGVPQTLADIYKSNEFAKANLTVFKTALELVYPDMLKDATITGTAFVPTDAVSTWLPVRGCHAAVVW